MNNINVLLSLRESGLSTRPVSGLLEKIAEHRLLCSQLKTTRYNIPSSAKSTFLTAFSADKQLIASSHGDHIVYVCNVYTGALIHTLKGHSRTPWTIVFHPTNRDLLASGCLAGEVRVWDLKTGCCDVFQVEERTAIASLAFHPEHRLLVIATADRLLLWDWSAHQPFAECRSPSSRERVRFVQFDVTGSQLFTGINNVFDGPERCNRSRYANPPPFIPHRCRELLDSRRELLALRSDLTRRHSHWMSRYTELVRNTNDANNASSTGPGSSRDTHVDSSGSGPSSSILTVSDAESCWTPVVSCWRFART